MAFWIVNKKDNTPAICTSVVAVSHLINVSKNTLYNYFSRDKLLTYENDTYRVEKVQVRRAFARTLK